MLLRGPSLGFCVRARGVSGSCPHLHVDASRGQESGRGSRARGLPTTGAASGLTLRCCWVLCRVIGGLGVATGGRGQPAGGPQRQRQEAGAPPSRSCGDPCSQWLRRGHGFLGPHGPGPVPSALGGGGHVRGLGKGRPRPPPQHASSCLVAAKESGGGVRAHLARPETSHVSHCHLCALGGAETRVQTAAVWPDAPGVGSPAPPPSPPRRAGRRQPAPRSAGAAFPGGSQFQGGA